MTAWARYVSGADDSLSAEAEAFALIAAENLLRWRKVLESKFKK